MQCAKCQDQLYEYFDGTLTPSQRESIREHLAQCPACFSAFEQERQFSKSMIGLLEQQSRDLRLAPQIRENVLARLQELKQENQISESRRRFLTYSFKKVGTGSLSVRPNGKTRRNRLLRPTRISIFGRLPQEILKIAAGIAILLAGFYGGNILWKKRATDIRTRLERETDWHYIMVSSRTCYFLNQPELQLMHGGKYHEN